MSERGDIPIPQAPANYWIARGMATNRSKTPASVIKGVDRAADYTWDQVEFMQKALGIVRNPDPKVRLEHYYEKPDLYDEAVELFQEGLIPVPYSWESQKAYFPRDFEEDQEDFQKLRIRAAKGEFGPELQARERSYSSGLLPDEADIFAEPEEDLGS